MKHCSGCNSLFDDMGDECPECKAADRVSDMAVGDNGR